MKRKLSQKFTAIKRSKDAVTVANNIGYLTALQFAGYIFPLITIPYLARVLGVDNFGKIAFASAVIVWFQTISDWGFNFTATRDVARNRDNLIKVSEIFSNVLWARLLLVLFSFLILFVLTVIIPQFNEQRDILFATFLLVPGHVLFPDWFFQAMERMKYVTILNITSKLVFTISIFLFVKQKSDYILQPLLISLGYLVSGGIALFIILFKWNIKLHRPRLSAILNSLRNSTDVFINNLMPNLYNSFSTVLLGILSGSVANGILDAGVKFINISQQFMGVISRAFFPFLSRKIEKHDVYVKINIVLSLCLSIVLFLSAPLIIKIFFTAEFYEAILVLRIMAVSIVFLSLINIYGTNYMIIIGKEKELRNITFICSIIGLCLSVPLIYYFHFYGAALTVTLTRGILGLGIMNRALYYKKHSSK